MNPRPPCSFSHSPSETQDRHRPSRQIPWHRSLNRGLGATSPLTQRCPNRSPQVQIAAHRPRSQNPSPHSPSLVQSRSGTFWDQGRACDSPRASRQSRAIALSSGENGSSGDGALASTASFAEDGRLGARGSGCWTRMPGGASSVDPQETAPARLAAPANPTMSIFARVRFMCVLMAMATGTPDRCRRGLQGKGSCPRTQHPPPVSTCCSRAPNMDQAHRRRPVSPRTTKGRITSGFARRPHTAIRHWRTPRCPSRS